MTNIKVALRVRPLSQKEIEGHYPVVVAVENHSAYITDIRVPERPSADSRQRFRQFDFDHTFWFSTSTHSSRNSASQQEVYNEMGPHLEKAILAGYNACLLAYGQSGSGKTHTMIGTREDPGIIPRLCHSLWEKLKVAHPPLANGKPSFRLEVSFLEIYREKVRDLLNPDKSLKLREHPQIGPHVQGLTRLEVTREMSLLDLLWEGERRRATGNTNSNRRSSRSHAIWTLYLTVHNSGTADTEKGNNHSRCSSNNDSLSGSGRSSLDRSCNRPGTTLSRSSEGKLITNQVHLVDLAGSEKADCTTAKSLLAEGADINRSLVALGNVISALAEKSQYIPYRDSALTWLLKDSIGGNASTSIIITASPSSHCHAQTLNSLRFAQRARLVENTPKINLASASYLGGGGVASPYGYLSVMSAMELKKDISRLAKIIQTAQNNGGILRGLAPRANWTRLIHAIEGIGQAEQEQVKLQRERASSEDATANATAPLASNSPSIASLSTPTSIQEDLPASLSCTSASKSLNDVMVQADRDLELSKRRHPLLNHLRRRHSRQQSDTALNTKPPSSQPTSSSTPTHSPAKIVGTEVFIPTSSSFKCLTWQQEEAHRVPKPVSSSSQSSLHSDDDDTSTVTSNNHQIHQLKYLTQVHYPVTHNLDHGSRISERIHGNIIDDYYQQRTKLFPTSVKKDKPLTLKDISVKRNIVTTLVNSQPLDDIQESFNDVVCPVEPSKPNKNAVMICNQGKEGKDYLFPMTCKHFATAHPSMPVVTLESSDEYEFDEPEELDLSSEQPLFRAILPETCNQKLSGANDDICCYSGVERSLGQIPTMIVSSSHLYQDDEDGMSSSSYEDINMPSFVRPVNLIREYSKLSDPLSEEVEENFPFTDDDLVYDEENVADVSFVVNEPFDTANTVEVIIEENPRLFVPDFVNRETVINGVSDCKFRNYFAKELHQMDRMGKQIKNLLQLTQRYNVVKPFLDEITNLQNADHSKEDPEMDKCIERCSGWNVEVELKKVEKEMSQLSKVLRTGIGQGQAHQSTSSTSTVNANESDSEVDAFYANYAHKKNIPLLSGSGGKTKGHRPPLPIPGKTVSQPCMSSSSSNNASCTSNNDLYGGGSKFTPNYYSTPVKVRPAENWRHASETISEDEVFEKPILQPVSEGVSAFWPHPAPPNLTSSQSLHTFYRNPSTIGEGHFIPGMGVDFNTSTENVSVSSSNMTSASTYNQYQRYPRQESSSSGRYPLNISYSDTSYLQGRTAKETSCGGLSSFQTYQQNQFGSMQNSFNLDDGTNQRTLSEATRGRSGSNYTQLYSLESGPRPTNRGASSSHLRSASDSLDLCSCGDTSSKYSLYGLGKVGLDKAISRSQYSSFGGSTLTNFTDVASDNSQFTTNTQTSAGSAAFYQKKFPSHHHYHISNAASSGGAGDNLLNKGLSKSTSSQDYFNYHKAGNKPAPYRMPSSSTIKHNENF